MLITRVIIQFDNVFQWKINIVNELDSNGKIIYHLFVR